MQTSMVTYPSNGGTGQGYLTVPDSGHGAGMIVIQEYWGLVDHIRDVARRFAREGFVALAPDLYQGEQTDEPDDAGKLMMALNIEQAAKDMRGAAQFLLDQGATTGDKVGIIGFCMGGQLALYAATIAPDQIGAVADFYGVHPNAQPDFTKLRAPVLGAFAEHDSYAPPPATKALEEQIRSHGIETDFKIYPDTHHGFFNDDRPGQYNQAAAEDAWNRSLRFFRQHLT